MRTPAHPQPRDTLPQPHAKRAPNARQKMKGPRCERLRRYAAETQTRIIGSRQPTAQGKRLMASTRDSTPRAMSFAARLKQVFMSLVPSIKTTQSIGWGAGERHRQLIQTAQAAFKGDLDAPWCGRKALLDNPPIRPQQPLKNSGPAHIDWIAKPCTARYTLRVISKGVAVTEAQCRPHTHRILSNHRIATPMVAANILDLRAAITQSHCRERA